MSHVTSSPEPSAALRARVVLLTGPSGSGTSHLAHRSGLPTVCLDDFSKDGDDPTLPRSELGIVDRDHPDAWDADRALASLVELAIAGTADMPIDDISHDRASGAQRVELGDAAVFVAEGIFAAHLVRACRDAGILADAMCLTHPPIVTFWRRLVRELREDRKAPLLLLRRGLTGHRPEPAIVAEHVALGAEPVHADEARQRLQQVAADPPTPRGDEIAA